MAKRKPRRKLVIGDIHGGLKGLQQALERCDYDQKQDKLIFTGDFVDGWSESFELISYLIRLSNAAYHKVEFILGNHDEEFIYWLQTGYHAWHWGQGALSTIESYAKALDLEIEKLPKKFENGMGWFISGIEPKDIPQNHKDFFDNLQLYYLDEETGQLFAHGGFNPNLPIKHQQNEYIYYWDRELVDIAIGYELGGEGTIRYRDDINEVFVGHTHTLKWGVTRPFQADSVVLIDTGAGFGGKVSVMDTASKTFWQSDNLRKLYPFETAR